MDDRKSLLIRERLLSLSDLREAICLKCANCYGAMSFANALGGTLTGAWELCHAHSLKELLAEAAEQGLDTSDFMSAIDGIPVQETMYYRRATGTITETEFRAEFSRWQRGE